MAKYFGIVGYGESTETPANSGIWKDVITEREYYGDIIRNARRLEEGETLNSDITPDNSISIVADPYANDHFFAIRYIHWAGNVWTVSHVEARPPRLILRLGSVYNGPTFEPPPDP